MSDGGQHCKHVRVFQSSFEFDQAAGGGWCVGGALCVHVRGDCPEDRLPLKKEQQPRRSRTGPYGERCFQRRMTFRRMRPSFSVSCMYVSGMYLFL
jgi:hypothetical protein